MSVIRIGTNFNIDLEFTLAPFHKRLIAWALDLILQVFYLVVATRFLRWISNHFEPNNDNAYNMWAIVLVLLLPFLLYHVVSEITMNGQSIGKRLMGIKVVSENGGKPSISQLIIRWLIRTSDYMLLTIILYAPYAVMFGEKFFYAVGGSVLLLATDIILVNASRKGQRLGDVLAHTILISTREQGDIEDTVFLQVDEKYVPRFPQVMQLSDRDINSLKSILDTAKKRHDFELAEKASVKIQSHLNIDTTLSPFDFLEILLKDYNALAIK